jgi:hypothetical protein
MARGGNGPKVSPWARHALTIYTLQADRPRNSLTAVSGVARLQGERPAAVFYPFGQPTPYAQSPMPASNIIRNQKLA